MKLNPQGDGIRKCGPNFKLGESFAHMPHAIHLGEFLLGIMMNVYLNKYYERHNLF